MNLSDLQHNEKFLLSQIQELEEEYYIIGSGEINKETAEYIVKLHNQNIKL